MIKTDIFMNIENSKLHIENSILTSRYKLFVSELSVIIGLDLLYFCLKYVLVRFDPMEKGLVLYQSWCQCLVLYQSWCQCLVLYQCLCQCTPPPRLTSREDAQLDTRGLLGLLLHPGG